MRILINGCSHSATEKYTHNKSWIDILSKKLKLKLHIINHCSYDFGFGENHYSYVKDKNFILSIANPGQSNDSILFNTLSTIRYFENIGTPFDYIFVQWSGPSRRLVSTPSSDYDFSNPVNNLKYGINFEPAGSFLTLNYMIILQDYLVKHDYNYSFLNYFKLDNKIQKKNYTFDELDLSKFISYKDKHPLFDGWLDSMVSDNLSRDSEGHPSNKGYELISDVFYNKIKKNIV